MKSRRQISSNGLPETLAGLVEALARRDGAAIYVSTPITTGPGLVQSPPRNSDEMESFLRRVRAENLSAAVSLVERVRRRLDGFVVDPTVLEDVPGWEQKDYHRFWVELINSYIDTVVFADGWQYSTGCALEFIAAVNAHCTLLDSQLRPLPLEVAARLLSEAGEELSVVGFDAQATTRAAAFAAAQANTKPGVVSA